VAEPGTGERPRNRRERTFWRASGGPGAAAPTATYLQFVSFRLFIHLVRPAGERRIQLPAGRFRQNMVCMERPKRERLHESSPRGLYLPGKGAQQRGERIGRGQL